MELDLKCSEIMCGFNVTIKRKKVWDKEIKLAIWFDSICKENNLRYFLYSGSLLGAIRHKGFIPWDDDMDFAMPRIDYEKFLKIAKNKMPPNFFIDNFYSNRSAVNGFTRIRDLSTTAFRSDVCNDDFPSYAGIFIDIFPFDNIPNSKIKRFFYFKKIWLIKRMVNNSPLVKHTKNLTFTRRILISFMSLYCRFIPPDSLFANFNNVLKKYDNNDACKECSLIVYGINSEYIIKRCLFDETIEYPFFQYNFLIPIKFDYLLRKLYGDYHKLIKNTQEHDISFFDPDKSYNFYELNYLEFIDEKFIDEEM